MVKTSIIVILCIFGISSAFCQKKIDSLMVVLDSARKEAKVKTLNELFRAYQQSDPVKALGYTREALALATEIDDQKGMAASYNNMGVSYRNQGALEKALEYYMTALKIYETLKNKEGVATLKNNIANLYAMKKDYGQAKRYLEESYSLFLELDDKNRVIGSMNNLGNLYIDLQLMEKAMKYFSEAYQLSEKNGIKFSDPLNNLGNIYFRQGSYQRAIEHYQKALAIEQENNNRLGMLNTYANIGVAHTKAGEIASAQKFLQEAKKLADELQAYTYLPTVLKHQAEIFHLQGNSSLAYKTLLQYDSLREKIYGEESTRKIAQMELVIDFQEKEKQYEILQQEDEIKTLELRNFKLIIVLSILGILLIIGIINIYFVGKRKKLISQ